MKKRMKKWKKFQPKRTKNPALQDSPPAAGCFCNIIPYRRSAIPADALRLFYFYLLISALLQNLRQFILLGFLHTLCFKRQILGGSLKRITLHSL